MKKEDPLGREVFFFSFCVRELLAFCLHCFSQDNGKNNCIPSQSLYISISYYSIAMTTSSYL